MSGSQIPVVFDFGDSAAQAQRVAQGISNTLTQINQVNASLERFAALLGRSGDSPAKDMVRDLQEANRVIGLMASAVSRLSIPDTLRLAEGRLSSQLERANREARVQSVGERGVPSQIRDARSVEQLSNIQTYLRRETEAATARRRELRAIERSSEGDALEDARRERTALDRRIRERKNQLSATNTRIQELLRVQGDQDSATRRVTNLERQIAQARDPGIRALEEQLRAARGRPQPSFNDRVQSGLQSGDVSRAVTAATYADPNRRDSLIANLEASARARMASRYNLENDGVYSSQQDLLALSGLRRRNRVGLMAQEDPELQAGEERLSRVRTIAGLQRRIRQAQDGEIQGLRDQLSALTGRAGRTPAQDVANAVQRLVTGAQAMSQAAADPATRWQITQAQVARANIGADASVLRFRDNQSYEQMRLLRMEGARLANDANERLFSNPLDREQMVRLGVLRGGVSDDIARQRMADPNVQALAVDRRRDSVRTGLTAEEGLDSETRQRRAATQRAQSREFLFGDGGANILETQARLMLQYQVLGQIQNAFAGVANAVVEYDRALRNLQAISGSTDKDMRSMSETIVGVSRNTRFSAVELAEVSTVMAQAGLSIREINQALNGVALLATATGSSLQTSADVYTAALGVFRSRAAETTTIANQMVAALNLSKLTMEQLALGIQYAGNIAAENNVSFVELTAALGTLANAGIRSGSTLGTGLRQLITDLENPTDRLRERLERLGVSMSDVNIRTRGIAAVMTTLRDAGFSTIDALQTMELRGANAFAALSRNVDGLRDFAGQLLLADGAMEANRVQMEALANRALQFANNLNALAFEAFGGVIRAMSDGLKTGSEFLQMLSGGGRSAEAFGNALTAMTAVIGGAWVIRLVAGVSAIAALRTAFVAAQTTMQAFALSAMTAGTATAAGIAVTTTAVTTLGTAVRLLFTTVPGFALLVGAGAAIYTIATSSDTATSALQRLRQAQDDNKSAADESKRNYEAVSDQIQRLSLREQELKRDDDALRGAIDETKTRFRDLDVAVFQNISSFDGLIGALNRLRTNINGGLIGDLIRLRTTLAETSAEYTTLLTRQAGANAATQFSPRDRQAIANNPMLAAAFSALTNQDPNQDDVRQGQLDLNRARLARRNNPNGEGVLSEAEDRLAQRILDRLQPVERTLQQRASANAQVTQQDRAIREAELRNLEPVRAAIQAREGAGALIEQSRNIADIPASDLRSGGGVVSATREALQARITQMDNAIAELMPSDRAEAAALLGPQRAELASALREFNRGINERLGERAVDAARTTGQRLEREITTLMTEARQPTTSVERRSQIREALFGEGGLITQRRDAAIEGFQNTPDFRRNQQGGDRDLGAARLAEFTAGEDARARETRTNFDSTTRGAEAGQIDAEISRLRGQATLIQSRINRRSTPAQRAEAQQEMRAVNDQLRVLEARRAELRRNGTGDLAGAGEGDRGGARVNRLGGSGGGSSAFARNPNYRQDFGDQLATINARASREERGARDEEAALRAEQDFASRNPDRIPETEQSRLRRRATDLQNRRDEESLAIQTRRAEETQTLIEQIESQAADLERRANELRTRLGGGADTNAEVQDIERRRRDLVGESGNDGILGRARESLADANDRRQRAVTIRDARRASDEFQPGAAFRSAADDFVLRNGGLDNLNVQLATFTRSTLQEAQQGVSRYFAEWARGSKTASEAIKGFATSFLESMLKIATDRAASQVISLILNFGVGALTGGVSGGAKTGFDGSGGAVAGLLGETGGGGLETGGFTLSKWQGGPARYSFAGGGVVPGRNVGRDSIVANIAPEEYIVSARGHKLVGTETLDAINRGQVAAVKQAPNAPMKGRDPDNVNVWVVSPDQKPSLGRKDVLAVIGEDIVTGGMTKRLIKNVQMGTV